MAKVVIQCLRTLFEMTYLRYYGNVSELRQPQQDSTRKARVEHRCHPARRVGVARRPAHCHCLWWVPPPVRKGRTTPVLKAEASSQCDLGTYQDAPFRFGSWHWVAPYGCGRHLGDAVGVLFAMMLQLSLFGHSGIIPVIGIFCIYVLYLYQVCCDDMVSVPIKYLEAIPDVARGAHHNRALTVIVRPPRSEPHEWQYRADTTVGQLRAEVARGKKIGLNTFKLTHNGNQVNDFDVFNALIPDEQDRIEFDMVRVPNCGPTAAPPSTPRQGRSRSRAPRARSPKNSGWRHLGRLGSRQRDGDQEIEVRLPNFTAWTLTLPPQSRWRTLEVTLHDMFTGLAQNIQMEHEDQVVNLMDIIPPSRDPVIVYVRAPGTRVVPGRLSPRRHRVGGACGSRDHPPPHDPPLDPPPDPPADVIDVDREPNQAVNVDASEHEDDQHAADPVGRRSVGVQTADHRAGPAYRFVVRIPDVHGDYTLELTDADLQYAPIEQIRPMDIELALFETYPYQLRAYDRLCLVDGDRALRHLQSLREQRAIYTTYRAIPSANAGTGDDGYAEALGLVGRSPAQLRKAQTRLLLQGEPGLVKKILKAKSDFGQIKAVMHAAAGRYNMQLLEVQATPATCPSVLKGQPKPESENGNWQTVKGRASHRSTSAPASRRDKTVQVVDEIYSLKDDDWDVPVRARLKAGEDGVLLMQSVAEAAKMTRTLAGTPNRYALVTLQPLSTAVNSQAITFRATTLVGPQRQIHDKILTGYLDQYGTSKVTHKWQIKEVDVPKGSTATTVILAKVRKDVVTEEEWDDAARLKDVRALNGHLQQEGLAAVACFHDRINNIDGVEELQFKVRVRVEEVDAYLRLDLPFTVNPLGDAALAYSIIWDRSCSSLQDLRARFADLPGYRGPVYSKGGVGVRVLAQHRDAALHVLGRPPGRLYLVQGLPLDVDHEAVQRCVNAIPWDGEVVSTSRRVIKGAATFRVRSGDAPPQEVLRVRFGDQQCTLRIQAQVPPARLGRETVKTNVPVRTWAEAARRAIGLQPDSYPTHDSEYVPEGEDAEMDDEISDPELEAVNGDDAEMEGLNLDDKEDTREVQHVAIGTPRPKRKSRVTPSEGQMSGRLDHLEGSLHELRSMMTQLLHNRAGQTACSAPKRQCPSPPAASARGSIPIPSGLEQAFEWHTVPGDGDCGWHALSTIINDNWNGFDPTDTPRFKAHILQELRDIQEDLAHMLGCGREHIQRIIGSWAPAHTWIDARGLLSAACLRGANILILNQTDQVMEILSPFGEHEPDTVYWCVRYENQHYSPGKALNWPLIAKYLETVTLKPWCPRRHLPGGSSSSSTSSLPSSFPPHADLPQHPVGTCVILAHVENDTVVEIDFVLKEHVFADKWPSVAAVNEYIRLMLPDQTTAWRLCELGVPIEESRAFPLGALMQGHIHAWPSPQASVGKHCGSGGAGEATREVGAYPKVHAKAVKPPRGKAARSDRKFRREPRTPQSKAVAATSHDTAHSGDASDSACGDEEEAASSDDADDDRHSFNRACIQIASLNVGGWRGNEATGIACLNESDSEYVVLALQETTLTHDGQKHATKNLSKHGYATLWGAPADLKQDKSGRYRAARGDCPGVGFVFSSSLSLTPIKPQTYAVCTWMTRGRVCMAWLKSQSFPEEGLLLVNIYAPSGNEQIELRGQFHEDIANELLMWGHTPSIVH